MIPENSMLIWQVFNLLLVGGVAFLVIRLLIVKNFPRKIRPGAPALSLDFYPIVISWSPGDRKFLAEVPDLPGCVADGATKAEALTASEVAIGHWIELARDLGREIPIPRKHLQIVA
ncbi:type II toxin-antitoxin system HicB family antitoxin [Hymenobacter caeli]|uniref:RNase H-like HicB family nuclease n=1 Tax=Hymenobacter caeli TaxID=2735894 RepID=A0ABX2FS36_9BACT|nr:type II toxin-antitoxin system HicB family antitoxin [Hymenobacter caeli]NRT19762.1 putative RNase H-like HicB family nuclease [Hymenobacter caeli]